MDYEKDIIIDHNALDVEWLQQTELAMRYGKHWAECVTKVQQCEENLKLIRSELVKEANLHPNKCLGKDVKPTAPNVESYYRKHEDHIEAKEELIQAQYELNIAEIAKKEISITRKAALENLVKLHGMNYFAGPSIPRNLNNEISQTKIDQKVKLTQPTTKKKFKRKKYPNF
jgi:hypothetical protein